VYKRLNPSPVLSSTSLQIRKIPPPTTDPVESYGPPLVVLSTAVKTARVALALLEKKPVLNLTGCVPFPPDESL
jgi:hypothetical protein